MVQNMEKKYSVIRYITFQENEGVRSLEKENLENIYDNQERNLQNIKNLEKNGKNHLKNITRKDLTTKDRMLLVQH